jgi:hypothetical protein
MPSLRLRALALLALAPAALSVPRLAAQENRDAGVFVTMLGSDTIAVERFARAGRRVEGDLLTRSPRTRLTHFVATLGKDGAVTRFETTTMPTASGTGDAPRERTVVSILGDSAIMEVTKGDTTRTMRGAVGRGALPSVAMTSYAMYEQAVRWLLGRKLDSTSVDVIFPGSKRTYPTAITRRGRDSVSIDFFGDPRLARIDGDGRILGVDASRTTVKVRVTRVAGVGVDIDALARASAERDAAGKGLGQLSTHESVRETIGGATLVVDYGRPLQRGRVIFGNLVPWNQVWRTGADAATGFTTDRELVLGGATVPAGSYTLWTLPTREGAKLIINKQTGQWGTEYTASQDLVRVDLAVERLAAPVERFTIALQPKDAGGVLQLRWENTQYSVPFTVK